MVASVSKATGGDFLSFISYRTSQKQAITDAYKWNFYLNFVINWFSISSLLRFVAECPTPRQSFCWLIKEFGTRKCLKPLCKSHNEKSIKLRPFLSREVTQNYNVAARLDLPPFHQIKKFATVYCDFDLQRAKEDTAKTNRRFDCHTSHCQYHQFCYFRWIDRSICTNRFFFEK